MSTEKATWGTKTVSRFQGIFHPNLKNLEAQKMAKYMKERKSYEYEVKKKQNGVPEIILEPFRVSIDHNVLETALFLGKTDKISYRTSVEILRHENVETFLRQIVDRGMDDIVDPIYFQNKDWTVAGVVY